MSATRDDCPQAARIELAAQEAKTAAGATAVALPSPNKLPTLEQDSSSPWGVKQRSIFRSDSAARLAAQQGGGKGVIWSHEMDKQYKLYTWLALRLWGCSGCQATC
jgi:hypothetical protein